MSDIRRVKLRTVLVSSCVTITVLAVMGMATALAVCVPTVYTVTSSAPPPTGNWTDTSGAVWTPSGGFPGCAPGDSASDTNASPTTIIINSSIPNPIISINLACNGCVIDIQSGGSLTLAGGGTIGSGSTLKVSGGTLAIASGGTLTFQGGSQFLFSAGTVDIQSGGTVDFQSGSNGMSTGGVMGGAGTLSISGGTLNIGSVTSPGTFVMTAGTLTGSGFLSVVNSMTWSGGTLTGSGGTELAGTGIGTIDGANGASAPMVLDGRAFNNYGTTNYTTTAAHPLQLSNGADFTTYGSFFFEDDGSITGASPSSFNVSPNGVVGKNGGFLTSTITPPFTNSGANAFASSGTLEFAGNTSSNGGIFFANNGATLAFSAPTSTFDASSFTATDASSTILFSAGSAVISGDYQVNGQTSIAGASVDIEPPAFATTSNFLFTSGGLTVNNDFTMTGTGTWSGGAITGSSTFDVAPGATLTIDAAISSPTIDGTNDLLFANDGTIDYTATPSSGNYLKFMNGAFLDNTGLFDIQTDAQIFAGSGVVSLAHGHPLSASERTLPGGSGRRRAVASAKHLRPRASGLCGCPNDFNNSGTLQKSAGTGASGMDFGPQLDNGGAVNALSGKLNFLDAYTQTAGSTTLGPGNIQVSSPLALNGGTLNGAGLVTGSVASNGGEVAPGTVSATGTINLTGNYSETSGSKLTIKIAGSGLFDQFNLTGGGVATLAGTFTGKFIGGYAPSTAGTITWSVLTYASHSGTFATVNLPTYSRGTVTSAYNPTSFDLTAVTPPAADLHLVMNGPASDSAAAPLSYTIDVSSLGPDATSGVITVADTLPAGATAAGGSGGGWSCGAPVGGVITCTSSTTLTNGNALPTLTISMTAPVATGNVTNSATVSNSVSDPSTANNTASVTTNIGPQANLSITKSGPATVNAGQNIVYTIVVTNAGPTAATATTVSDPTPIGIAFVSNSNGCTSAFPCNLGTLNAGQSVTITSTYSVPNSYSGGSISNTASVSSSVNDPNLTDNSATATTTVTAAAGNADVSIAKTGPPSVTVAQNISYTITVTNSGPAAAANTFVSDPTPAGLTFVSNSGACTGPFPCALGTMSNGQSASITSTYSVPSNYANPTITNTATVSTSSPETNTSNNSSTVTTPISSSAVADLSVTKTGPGQASPGNIVNFAVIVTNNGPDTANNVIVNDPTPVGLGFVSNSGPCATSYPCNLGSMPPGAIRAITSRYQVLAQSGTITNSAQAISSASDPVPSNSIASASITIVPGIVCPQTPSITSPAPGATVASPFILSWLTASGASSYIVSITAPDASVQTFPTAGGSLTLSLPNGAYSWNVQAVGTPGCPPAISASSTFSVCNTPGVPIPSVVSLTTTGQAYTVQWAPIDGATSYVLQESSDAAFAAPISTSLAGTQQTFTRNVQTATAFYYRVRVNGSCSQTPGVFSSTASVIVVPLPPLGTLNPDIPVPAGSTQPVTFQIHVNGLTGVTTSFVATVDKPWLAVTPGSGIMPPEGVNFTIAADPSSLQNGTWTGTVIIAFGSSSVSGKRALDVTPKTSIPVSISLTTPVNPANLSGPAATAVVIPSVGHLAGLGSQWQSDIRIANITGLAKNVQLTFSGGSPTSSAVKQTILNIAAGATTALDDMVANWFGVGAMGDSSNGVLTVQPLDASGKPDLSISKATVASSRTYNVSAAGTLGQFIPAVPLANFISKAPGGSSVLALQQIAQSDTFRTNLGLVEVTGNPASVLVSVFDAAGSKLLDLPVSLAAGEQRQLNSFLANQGITLTNGHIEVSATGGTGKVTAYASVIDDRSTDPLLVSGIPIGGTGATRFVIPGVASLDSGASWRSDVRIFNGSASPQTATLTLYPTGNPSANVVQTATIQPGEVKALDDIVHATFNLTNAGGALHVTTAVATPLVVTARTYDSTPGGTLGQFVQAVTPADAVGNGGATLQLLQMEDSTRYRTNLGLAEVTGQPATAEVTIILPDSKVAPKVQIPLAPFEYRQFAIFQSLGLTNSYNARITVRVIDGQGKVTAYGSVIDQITQDPTYVPAQ